MGVGAIFISTLATLRLEEPQNPPQNQQQLLASTLQPIVAFVVLGSIIIRASSSIRSVIYVYHPAQMVSLFLFSRSVAVYTPAPCRCPNRSPDT